MKAIFDILKNFWDIIANTDGMYTLKDLSILQVVFVVLFIYFVFKLLKLVFSNTSQGLKTISKAVKKVATYRQRKMARVICQRCGRHLDKCTCEVNKKLPLKKRYKRYKAQKKLQRLEAKARQE